MGTMLPVLILLPGMDGTGELFEPLLRILPSEIRTIVVRYPNRPQKFASLRTTIKEALPGNSSYVLLGESFSGRLAVSIAAGHPPGLVGYILVASFLRCPSVLLRGFPFIARMYMRAAIPRLAIRNRLLGRFSTPSLMAALDRALDQVSDATMRSRLQNLADADVVGDFSRVQLPGLYLRADEDRIVPASTGDALVASGTNLRVESISAPHMLLQAAPAQAAKIIFEFLAQVGPRQEQRNCGISGFPESVVSQ